MLHQEVVEALEQGLELRKKIQKVERSLLNKGYIKKKTEKDENYWKQVISFARYAKEEETSFSWFGDTNPKKEKDLSRQIWEWSYKLNNSKFDFPPTGYSKNWKGLKENYGSNERIEFQIYTTELYELKRQINSISDLMDEELSKKISRFVKNAKKNFNNVKIITKDIK